MKFEEAENDDDYTYNFLKDKKTEREEEKKAKDPNAFLDVD